MGRYDWERKELKLPQTKAGRAHYIPLSDSVLDIFRKLPRQLGNPFILCGHIHGRGLINISKPWKRIKLAAGVKDLRLHDLRRTVGSWLAQEGNSLHLIGRVLNHTSVATTQVYARFADVQVRKALELHAEKVLGISDEPSNTTALALKKA